MGGHEPVLVDECVDLLVPALEHGGIFCDATLGRGGHARRVLQAAPDAHLVGIDRDPRAVEESRAVLDAFGDRVRLVRDDFENLPSLLERLGVTTLRGVLLDLGVSSPQLDDPRRGFGYRSDGPLDMRMDPSQELSADVVVNTYPEADLARVVRVFGEERFARRVARGIVAARPVRSTGQLADVVRDAIPAATRRTGGHPARRTFQAIRIEVNDEIGKLIRVLPACVDALEPGGRMVVLAYHSLEDRAVKRFFADAARGCVCPPDFPVCRCGAHALVRILTKRPVRPTPEEIASNPRSSAAKLRAAERLGQTAGDEDEREVAA